jgi:hypothetical protein
MQLKFLPAGNTENEMPTLSRTQTLTLFIAAGAQPKLESDIKSETGVSVPTSRYSFVLKLKFNFLFKNSGEKLMYSNG